MYLFKYKLIDGEESEIRSTMGDEIRVEEKHGQLTWQTEEKVDKDSGETKTIVTGIDTSKGTYFERTMYTVFVALCRAKVIDGAYNEPSSWNQYLDTIEYVERVVENESDGSDEFEDTVLNPTETDTKE